MTEDRQLPPEDTIDRGGAWTSFMSCDNPAHVEGTFCSLLIWHRANATGDWCAGSVWFDTPCRREPRWTVESMEPLTLSPSILCSCGFHGFIRDGRWVSA